MRTSRAIHTEIGVAEHQGAARAVQTNCIRGPQLTQCKCALSRRRPAAASYLHCALKCEPSPRTVVHCAL